jgi:hypothetical protein
MLKDCACSGIGAEFTPCRNSLSWPFDPPATGCMPYEFVASCDSPVLEVIRPDSAAGSVGCGLSPLELV